MRKCDGVGELVELMGGEEGNVLGKGAETARIQSQAVARNCAAGQVSAGIGIVGSGRWAVGSED